MKDLITKMKILPDISIKEALKKIDESGYGILFVCDKNDSLLGTLTDGDIRRRILKTGNLQENIVHCYNRNPVFVRVNNYSITSVKRVMLETLIEIIPVIDSRKKIVDVLFWKDLFEEDSVTYKKIDAPVVIMAGGKGERLGPFTKILPKPLIPVGEKPVIEIIMDKFNHYGVTHFYITLSYKGEMIKTYLESLKNKYKIDYIWEKELSGTAKSLRFIASRLEDTFIVTNCDIIVNTDYGDLLSFHKEQKNILTVVGSIQHLTIPYGLIHFEKEGKIQKIQEKPEIDITINTGLYVLSREALGSISEDKRFDMTDLLQVLLDKNEPVGVYPVSQNSYIDIGQWEEYKKAIETF